MAAKRSGANPPELNIPPEPRELHWVLPFFRRLGPRRPYEQGVPMPIRHSEVEALLRLEGRRMRDWELEALEILDAAWLHAVVPAMQRLQSPPQGP